MKMNFILILVLLLMTQVTAIVAENKMPESREYKILLKAENFVSFNKGCDLFWELVEKVAFDHGVKVKKAEKSFASRDICFLDTADFSLYKRGFVLRLRAANLNVAQGQNLTSDTEMTLKFRASDRELVQIAPIKQISGEISFEEDLSVNATGLISLFSASSVVFMPDALPSDLDSLLRFYPDLKNAGFSGTVPLKVVNDILVKEKRFRSGELKFAQNKAKTVFSAWYENGSTSPFVSEFSCKIKLKDKNPAQLIRNIERIDNFFTDLVKRGKFFVAQGQTKTGMVYGKR